MCLEQRSGKWHYKDWQTFEREFKELFCTKNGQVTVLTKLEGMSWYQGRDLVKDYIYLFSKLVNLAEYLDDKTIVIKFQKGLDSAIHNMLAVRDDLQLSTFLPLPSLVL